MSDKEYKRNLEIEEARTRRRKRRKRVVMIQRGTIALVAVSLIVGGSLLAYNMQPEVKLEKQLKAADEYMEEDNYEEVIASCEEALKIDSTSVKAYNAMAGAYLTQENPEEAKKVLYQGWEVTHDESLMQYYCTVRLNEAVAEINAQNCSFATWEKCIEVLEDAPDNTDVYTLLDAVYERVNMSGAELDAIFNDTAAESENQYEAYETLLNRMIAVYEKTPSEALLEEIVKFALPDREMIWMDMPQAEQYKGIVSKVAQLAEDGELWQMSVCIDKALEMQTFFAEAFAIFETGEFEPIKDFMQKEEYIAIRDQFMDGSMEFWEGKTYIPVSREKIKLMNRDGIWMFAFPDYEEYPEADGLVQIWSAKQEDDGVQRLCISYEPALVNGEYYPHTTYEFIYLYSNVRIGGVDTPQMNYRFETRVATPEETLTTVIGDWGGEHEFDMEF